MESLGKELDLAGKRVNQGLTVFGNKGSTDQHSYIQQLREGLDNFFAVFIEVLKDRHGRSIAVEPETTTGDFLHGFYLGTREALYENGRHSITITIPEVTPFIVGALIALFERAVGLYAALININAYHQPGVQAGKVAADVIIKLKVAVIEYLQSNSAGGQSAEDIAKAIGATDQVESVFKICEHLAANTDRQILKSPGKTPFLATFRKA
jgi:glucose-6-phosphate isomerase